MKTSGNHCWLPFLFINKLVFETVNRYYSTHAEYTYIYIWIPCFFRNEVCQNFF